MFRIVDEKPNPAGAGDLVLPLLERLSVVSFARKLTLESVMTIGVYATSWIDGKSCMHLGAVPCCDVAQLGPTLGCLLVGEAQIPLRSDGWTGDAISAPTHRGEGTSPSKASLAWSLCRAASVSGFDQA